MSNLHLKYYVNNSTMSFFIYFWQMSPANKTPANPHEVKLKVYFFIIVSSEMCLGIGLALLS